MKRDEMIHLISAKLQKSDNMFIGYNKGSINLKCLCDNLAHRVLKLVEDKGMVPPEIDSGVYSRQDCGNYMVHEWESEDEDPTDPNDDPNYCGAV